MVCTETGDVIHGNVINLWMINSFSLDVLNCIKEKNMKIQVENCNNIDIANVELVENKLNIKLAPNGTGKSTIARAIVLNIDSPDDLVNELMPFKYRESNPDKVVPKVIGTSGIKSVLCFNEEYVKQFQFQQEELLSNSFDILIRNEEYKDIEQEIESLVSETRRIFTDNTELESLITSLKELSGSFKLTKTGISRSSVGMKGLKDGNKIHNIPKGLEPYKSFIQSEDSVSWIDWQSKGCSFSKLSENCPFCTTDTSKKKELIVRVGKEYDKNNIKNLIGIIYIIEKLGDYLSDNAKNKLNVITKLKDGIDSEHEQYIINLKNQIDNFIEKLEKIRELSAFQFSEKDNVEDKLISYKLKLEFFSELDSDKMNQAIHPINLSVDNVIQKAGLLKGKINIQRKKMRLLIESHEKNINEFLAYAGFKYRVNIDGENDDAKLKLRHVDFNKHLNGGNQYLSFGERNAFSIVLFMYECLSKKPDIIILDDPISSFDKNKKYAILEMLFRREESNCLKNKTVLMLTHDVEPIIDTVKSLSHKFCNLTTASFLQLHNGRIIDKKISKREIKTFSEICKEVLESSKDEIIKLIYLRRNYEVLDEEGDVYQVISNLLHKRYVPIDKRKGKDENHDYPRMDQDKFDKACLDINKYIKDFEYNRILERLRNIDEIVALYNISQNGYEKLQIFRLLGIDNLNSVIQKFINETYHIENEYICQLSPAQFDTIPEYVIKECDKVISKNLH